MAQKLAGPNHSTWAAGIRERLQRLGLWELVDATKSVEIDASASSLRSTGATRRQVERVNRLIVDSVEPHVLQDLLMTALPSNLWNVLEEKYRDQAYGSVMEKAFAYFDARFDETLMTLDDHVGLMAARVETLATMGFNVTEDVQVMVLLRSLKGSRCAAFLQEARRLPQAPSLASVVEKLRGVAAAAAPSSSNAAHPATMAGTRSESSATSSFASWEAVSPCTTSTASLGTSEFSEETMYAFARAVHASSADSFVATTNTHTSSSSSSNSSWSPSWDCAEKRQSSA